MGALRTLRGSSRSQVRSATDVAGGLGLPLPLLIPQLPHVEWLGPAHNRLLYITQRETVFWDWTFLTSDGKEQPQGLIPQLGPQASTGICLHSCLITTPKVELFHWENIVPTLFLDTNEHFFFVTNVTLTCVPFIDLPLQSLVYISHSDPTRQKCLPIFIWEIRS